MHGNLDNDEKEQFRKYEKKGNKGMCDNLDVGKKKRGQQKEKGNEINGEHTTKYYKLERGARQGDPILAYLFILALKIFFIVIKTNKNINGLKIFDHEYLYSMYTDDTTFFLEDISSIKVVLKVLNSSFGFSGLCPKFTKCKMAGIGNQKSVDVALCGMKCLDLTKECIKVLGVHILYNKKLQDNKNFCDRVKNIYNVIKL